MIRGEPGGGVGHVTCRPWPSNHGWPPTQSRDPGRLRGWRSPTVKVATGCHMTPRLHHVTPKKGRVEGDHVIPAGHMASEGSVWMAGHVTSRQRVIATWPGVRPGGFSRLRGLDGRSRDIKATWPGGHMRLRCLRAGSHDTAPRAAGLAMRHQTAPWDGGHVTSRQPRIESHGAWAASRDRHMTSTKNSLGFPMAMWKDWRLAVSSGGTEARSRTGGAPGGCTEAGPALGGPGGIIITIMGL